MKHIIRDFFGYREGDTYIIQVPEEDEPDYRSILEIVSATLNQIQRFCVESRDEFISIMSLPGPEDCLDDSAVLYGQLPQYEAFMADKFIEAAEYRDSSPSLNRTLNFLSRTRGWKYSLLSDCEIFDSKESEFRFI